MLHLAAKAGVALGLIVALVDTADARRLENKERGQKHQQDDEYGPVAMRTHHIVIPMGSGISRHTVGLLSKTVWEL